MCENVVSISFKLLNQNQLTENEAKDFASKNILGNVQSILTKIINEIRKIIEKQDVQKFAYELTQQIDQALMEVLKSLAAYYPQAPPAGNTAKMRQVIVNVNRSEDETTDLIYNLDIKIDKYIRRKSWDSGQILTSYEEYTGFIMEVINATIEVTRGAAASEAEQTVFQKFVQFSQRLFCTSQHKYYKILINKIIQKQNTKQTTEEENDLIIKYYKKILSGQEVEADENWAIQTIQQKLDLVKGFFSFLGPKKDIKKLSKRQYLQTIKSEYDEQLQKMKKAHKHAISQKIPAYVKPFSRSDLKENKFFVNNSSVLRIMTKWAQKLEQIFTKSQKIIKQRQYYFKTTKNELIPPSQNIKKILHQNLARQYIKVKQQFAMLKDKNTLLQSYFLTQSKYDSQNSYLSRYTNERCIASKINATLIQSMRKYLCILIHHLLIAGSDIPAGTKKQHINLIIFQVNDLLRSKFQCNQTTFINILNTIYQLDKSSQMRDKFKLVRVKNKLDQKDNNILINYMFLGKVQCQLQLSIQQIKTKQKNYYNFSHFVYELTRGKFGAITQCSIIVAQHDPIVNSSTSGMFYKPKKSQKLQKQKGVQVDAIEFERVSMKDSNLFVCFDCKNFVINDNHHLFEEIDNKCNNCIIKLNNPEVFIKNQKIKNFLVHKTNKHVKKVASYSQIKQGNYILMLTSSGNKKDAIKVFKVWYHPREFKLFMIQINSAILTHVADDNFEYQEFNYFDIEDEVKKNKKMNQLAYTLQEKHFIQVTQLLSIEKEPLANMPTLIKKFQAYRVEKNLIKSIKYKAEIIDLSGDELKLSLFKRIIDQDPQSTSRNSFHQQKKDFLKYKKHKSIEFANLKNINFDNLGLQEMPINLKDIRNLTRINIQKNNLKTLDISQITSLNNLDVRSNQLVSIDITKNTQLVTLDLSENKLTELDLSFNENLVELDVQKNILSELFLQNCQDLIYLNLAKNKLAEIDVSQNVNLKFLHLGYNNINKIDLSFNTSLQEVSLNNNRFKYIDLTKNTKLTSINLSANSLPSVDLTKNINLMNAYLQCNQIILIDLSKNQCLVNLNLYKNKLTQVYLTKNTRLTSLYLYNNELTQIDLTKNVALCTLNLYNNRIKEIDLSKNTNLITLDLSYNELWAISLHRNYKLINLDLRSNQLPSLDLSSNTHLMNISMQLNKLSTISFCFSKELNLGGVDFRNQLSDKCNIFIYYDKSQQQQCQQLLKKLYSLPNNKKCRFSLVLRN